MFYGFREGWNSAWTKKKSNSMILSLFSQRTTKLNLVGSGVTILIELKKDHWIHKVTVIIYGCDTWCCLQSQKDVISELNWSGWQKEHIRKVLIWQFQIQHILHRLHFGEQLFTEKYAKHAQYLLCVNDKIK